MKKKRLTRIAIGNEIQTKKTIEFDHQKCPLSNKMFWLNDQQLPFDHFQLPE